MKKHPLEPFWRITADEANAMLDDDASRIQLVHLQDEHDPNGKYIRGAICVPFAWVTERLADLDADRPILMVCAVGTRSAFAAEVACSLGKSEVYNLEGGIAAWQKAGFPAESKADLQDDTGS
jgi:rhodanese-related sulfurtransferase